MLLYHEISPAFSETRSVDENTLAALRRPFSEIVVYVHV